MSAASCVASETAPDNAGYGCAKSSPVAHLSSTDSGFASDFKKKAAVAVSHSILVICWHLLTERRDYDDLGGDYFVRRNNPDRRRDDVIQQLHGLGYRVTLDQIAA